MDRKATLLSVMRNTALDMAKFCKEEGDVLGYNMQMEKANAYASAMYILTDKDYFESMCQICNIK